MRKFTRELSLIEVGNLFNICKIVCAKKESSISPIDKINIAKLSKKVDAQFEDEQENYNFRAEKAREAKKPSFPFVDQDKGKKMVEIKHSELTAIAHCFLEVLNDKEKCTVDDVGDVLNLADDSCLKLERYLLDNFKDDENKFIKTPEDDNIAPEDETVDPEGPIVPEDVEETE